MNIIETHGTLEIRTSESIVSVSRVVQIIISLVTSSKESTNIYIYTYWNSLSTLFHALFRSKSASPSKGKKIRETFIKENNLNRDRRTNGWKM